MGERVLGGHCSSLNYAGFGLSPLGQPHVLASSVHKGKDIFEAGFPSHKES